jgi:phosphoglycerate dehydrogenase-like enzyme
MSDFDFSRRLFLSAAAATPALAVDSSDRIAIFDPPPARTRLLTATARSVVGPARYTDAEIKQIVSAGKNVEFIIPKNQQELDAALPTADAILGSLNADMLAKAKNLKWLQATEAGLETTLFPELVKSNVVVTNMARMFAPALGETAFSMLLALTRGLQQYYIPQFTKKEWRSQRNLVELQGAPYSNEALRTAKTIGIVGCGGLGQASAKIAKYGFNMRVLAIDPKPMEKPVFVDELRDPSWLLEMVPQCDVLLCAVPWVPPMPAAGRPAGYVTEGMFNAKVFAAMKKTAYFILISRGPLVDEKALVAALKESRIAGAGLDVVSPEPYPATGAYWDCPNLMITQHSGGFAPERQTRLIGLIADNVHRFSNGLPLVNVCDKLRGY